MIKFTYNKVYNYVQNKSAFDIFMDVVMTALGSIAFGGILAMISVSYTHLTLPTKA